MNNRFLYRLTVLTLTLSLLSACENEISNPKPETFLKLDISDYTFHKEKGNGPYQFEMPDVWTLKDPLVPFNDTICQEEIDIATGLYPPYPREKPWDGLLGLKYWKLPDKKYLPNLMHDIFIEYIDRETTKASSREYSNVIDYESKVYGTIIEWEGNGVGSPLQFYLTDSLENVILGQVIVRYDKYGAAEQRLNHLKSGVLEMINTFEWLND